MALIALRGAAAVLASKGVPCCQSLRESVVYCQAIAAGWAQGACQS